MSPNDESVSAVTYLVKWFSKKKNVRAKGPIALTLQRLI